MDELTLKIVEWDQKLSQAVTRLEKAHSLSYELSYSSKFSIRVCGAVDVSGEPAGTRTQGPRLKRANQTIGLNVPEREGL